MAQRPHLPKFGNWENEDNVPYTAYFEKARKGKTGGKMMNPNDPQENPEMFSKFAPPSPSPAPAPRPHSRNEPEEPAGRRAVRPTHERKASKEDGDLNQSNDYLAPNDNLVRRTSGGPTNQRGSGHGSGSGSGRQGRTSGGSENNSIEQSPMHPQYQAKLTGRGSASPAWEGKSLYDGSHGTPGRSRMKPTESPDRGAAVPRFGIWDVSNPSSADNYTYIFNKLREEKATGSPMVGNDAARTPNRAVRNETTKDNKVLSSALLFSQSSVAKLLPVPNGTAPPLSNN